MIFQKSWKILSASQSTGFDYSFYSNVMSCTQSHFSLSHEGHLHSKGSFPYGAYRTKLRKLKVQLLTGIKARTRHIYCADEGKKQRNTKSSGSQVNLTFTWYVFLCNIFSLSWGLQQWSCCMAIPRNLGDCSSQALKCQVHLHSVDRTHFGAQAPAVNSNKQPLCAVSKHWLGPRLQEGLRIARTQNMQLAAHVEQPTFLIAS